MHIEQYVMAYQVDQDRLRAMLPPGFSSLRPVLRINAEVQDGKCGYVEFNTAVEKNGTRGWLNIGHWTAVPFEKTDKTTSFQTDFLTLSFTGVGIEGSCPAEKDNAGCYFTTEDTEELRKPEIITAKKEFCDCQFAWRFTEDNAHGRSIGKTLPAYPTEVKTIYPNVTFSAENAAKIPCIQVLGTYKICFERQPRQGVPG